jgi:hypothetical protein
MKAQIHTLQLVYCPVSNQEAEWIKDDPDVQKSISHSNLYMIGQRAEAKYVFNENAIEKNIQDLKIIFQFTTNSSSSEVVLDLQEIFQNKDVDLSSKAFDIEIGPKLIRIWTWDKKENCRMEIVDWFTTEKLLHDKWAGVPGITGFDNYKEFTRYYLHYVGISKKEDSLTRLVVKPHDKRLRILSNEGAMSDFARLTDELVLFFFRIEPLRISTYSADDIDISELSGEFLFDKIAIIADAEKAFVKILNSQYNTEKYSNYPKGKDGLYNAGLDRYGYVIGEDISFITDSNIINGMYYPDGVPMGNGADMIFIQGDRVTLEKFSEIT